ncbi:hypothetical protein LDL08_25965 [Nonomuraea glycinis]|uniref:Ig-like domain repeat protein n=1 Tax=Nonomuraea glycinis TaxID=2047744 RepID=A0A918AD51_9ACTN|nr:hypothetical protein [Nonomuraea glycinis]MCA2179632.1 hypothetical protein [Nonomuraea glycinis]GGP15271.1 hypothetical protein GCM10012278_74350 [Nonomuraea glycinis]
MRHPLIRRLAAYCGAVGLITGLLTVSAPAASAADTTTDLGVSLDSFTADIAVGGGQVFVSAADRIIVADRGGNVTGGAVTGLSGVDGLALNTGATRLYAALTGSNEVAEIDTASRTVLRRIDLSAHPCPSTLALSGQWLWVGHGCAGEEGGDDGGAVGLDLTAAAPTPVTLGRVHARTPVLAVAGDTLVVGETGLRRSDLLVYDIGGGTPTLRGEIDGQRWDLDKLNELTLTFDGSTLIAAADAPGHFTKFDTTTLTATGAYGDGWDGYPAGVAIDSRGAYVAAGRQWGSTDLTLYDAATGAVTYSADQPDAEVVPGGVVFSGQDVYTLLRNSAGRLLLWRLHGVTLPASELTLTAPARVRSGGSVTLEGRITRTSGKSRIVRPLAVTRRLPDGTSVPLDSVTAGEDGRFTFTDTPPGVGEVTYTVLWDGDSRSRWSSASATVTFMHISSLTLDGPASGTVGEPVELTGVLTVGDRQPEPGATITVQRSVTNDGDPETVILPPVSTDADGSYTFIDTLETAGRYTYIAIWTGHATAGRATTHHRVTVTLGSSG